MKKEGIVHIIFDDSAVLESLEMLLKTYGFAVRTHPSADSFLRYVEARAEGGVVVTDVEMPGMSGIELLSEFPRRGFDWPVIIMTGRRYANVAAEAILLGAFDFLEKPHIWGASGQG